MAAAMDASAVVSLLQSPDAVRVVGGLDGWCRSLLAAPYHISSSFFPTFALILHRLLAAAAPSSSPSSFPSASASLPSSSQAHAWRSLSSSSPSDAVPPLVLASPRGFDLLLPSSPLFELVFFRCSFPPLYSLPLSQLPSSVQQRVRAVLAGDGYTAASCPLASLYRSSYSAEADALQLSMADFLFFHLALLATQQQPTHSQPSAAAAGSPAGRGGAAQAGGLDPRLASALPLVSSSSSSAPAVFGWADAQLRYQQLLQAYFVCFLPPAQPSAVARLHGLRLAQVLAEVWMGDSVGAMEGAAADDADDGGGSAGDVSRYGPPGGGAPSSSSFPFLPFAQSSASLLRSSSSSSLPCFIFPSVQLTGCVRLLVQHLLSMPTVPQGATAATGGATADAERGRRRLAATAAARTAPQPSPSSSSSSSSTASPSAPSAFSCVDCLLFRFLRSALLQPPSVYEERLQAVVALWLTVLSSPLHSTPAAAPSAAAQQPALGAAAPPPSVSRVSAVFPFFSPLLLSYLRALLQVDIGREGSSVRGQVLSHLLQAMRTVDALHPQLAELESLLLRGREDGEAATARRAGPTAATPPASAANSAASAVARAEYSRIRLASPEAALLQPLFTAAAGAFSPSALSPPGQLLVDVLRLTTPSSIRLALSSAPSPTSSSSILPPLAPSSSSSSSSLSSPASLPRSSSAAFRTLLVQEERTWRQTRDIACSTFRIPPLDDDQHSRSAAPADSRATPQPLSSSASASSPPPPASAAAQRFGVRSLSPERLQRDSFHRLSERGRLQLRGGLALCTKHSPALAFIGDDWDAPASAHESHTALQLLRVGRITARAAIQRARYRQQAAAPCERQEGAAADGVGQSAAATALWLLDAALDRAPLRLLARRDVLACVAAALAAALLFLALRSRCRAPAVA